MKINSGIGILSGSKRLPIVFIHKGENRKHLPYVFAQAFSSNSGAEIYTIGDHATRLYSFIRHREVSDYFQGAKDFAGVYQHMSTNDFNFERFCFQRWFILLEFMQAENLEACFILDSDVLLYSRIQSLFQYYQQYKITVVNDWMASSIFIIERAGLEALCQFMLQMYTDPYWLEQAQRKYEIDLLNDQGGVCDMTAFQFFRLSHPGEIGEAGRIINNATFDFTLYDTQGYEMDGNLRRFYWKDGVPYCKHLESGQLIRFHTLHLQGPGKRLAGKFYTGSKPLLWLLKGERYLYRAYEKSANVVRKL